MTGPRILVAGREGQVARALREADADATIVALGRPDLDLTDPATLRRAVADVAPDIVVNAAAYTAVDRAEEEPDAAMAVNAVGAGHLAGAAAARGIPLIHLSTDYVFDGRLGRPYREDDPVGPAGAYGRSKLDGERRVSETMGAAGGRHAIVRTSWVHAPYGGNFVRTMLRLAEARDEVRVVADQRGRPTYAPHMADALLALARAMLSDDGVDEGASSGAGSRASGGVGGTFHVAGGGETTWAGLAGAVFEASGALGGPVARVVPIGTVDYPTAAARPPDSRLDTSRFEAATGHVMPPWRDGVRACVAALLERAD